MTSGVLWIIILGNPFTLIELGGILSGLAILVLGRT